MSGPLRHRLRYPAPQALALAGSSLPAGALPRAAALARLSALAAALALAGCGGPGVRATIVNRACTPLAKLRLVAEADSTSVRDLAPGESVTVRARVRAQGALVLRGRLGGRPLAPMMAVYVEGGGRLRLVVDSTGFVAVTALAPAPR